MKTELSLDTWNRREHFEFFSRFEEPFFSLVTNVDATSAYHKMKAEKGSFYLYYLFQALTAANNLPAFRYRIEESKIFCYDVIHASPTVLRSDTTFGFAFMKYLPAFASFAASAQSEITTVKESNGLCLSENTNRLDVIHFSSIPWITFTGLSHARSFTYKDSIPKISFGKYFREQNKLMLPVSITVHHGLMDGYHMGEFVTTYQNSLNQE